MLKVNQLIGFGTEGYPPVVAGNVSYTVPGSNTFVIEPFNTLTVTIWGAGGGGVGVQSGTYGNGTDGTPSWWDGGVAAGKPQANNGIAGNVTAGGAGGTASGGDTNTSGNAGVKAGGSSPNGGAGGAAVSPASAGIPGGAPGGGGSGAAFSDRYGTVTGGGGGGGAYCQKTYSRNDYPVGTEINLQIGDGGNGGNMLHDGGAGANGKIIVAWA